MLNVRLPCLLRVYYMLSSVIFGQSMRGYHRTVEIVVFSSFCDRLYYFIKLVSMEFMVAE